MKFSFVFVALLQCSLLFSQDFVPVPISENHDLIADDSLWLNVEVRIYPNPVLYTFIVDCDLDLRREGDLSFDLYDREGRLVISIARLRQPVQIIDRKQLPGGSYTYRVHSKGKTIKSGILIFSGEN